MYRTNKCETCLYLEADVQVDMGVTLDECKLVSNNVDLWGGLMCDPYKAKRNGEPVINGCPFYKKKEKRSYKLDKENKEKLKAWYEQNAKEKR